MIQQIEPADIQKLAIKALFSDDYLISKIVLKGGNALVHVHNLVNRTSLDIDVSIRGDLDRSQDELLSMLINSFQKVFGANDLIVFDTRFTKRPIRSSSIDLEEFWGGYSFEFKVIHKKDYERIGHNIDQLRRESLVVDSLSRKSFVVDFSKQEYCDPSIEVEFEAHRIVVYTPLLIVIEKLRAICQQQPEYLSVVPTMKRAPRTRDFFDIYTILETEDKRKELISDTTFTIIKEVFRSKRVPLSYLLMLEKSRDFHETGYSQLEASIPRGLEVLPFGFYFDYVLKIVKDLNSFIVKEGI